jgi:succinoglycan biosynthesis transport protein ExoP
MTLRPTNIVRRNWKLLVSVIVVVVGAVGAILVTEKPSYTATAELFVGTNATGSSVEVEQAYDGGLLAVARVASYVPLVTTPEVMNAVIKDLDLHESRTALQNQITASAPTNTVLVRIAASENSAALAKSIANTTGEEFADYANKLEAPEPTIQSPLDVRVVSSATLPGNPTSPRTKLDLVLAVLLGCALGLVAVLIRERVDRRVRDHGQVDIHGVAVLGRVPPSPTGSRGHRVLGGTAQSSRRNAAFSTILGRLQRVNAHPGQCWLITGVDRGSAAAEAAVGLASTLGTAGRSVLLIDADFDDTFATTFTGVTPENGLRRLLNGESVDEVSTPNSLSESWLTIPAAAGPDGQSDLLSDSLARTLSGLGRQFGVLLIVTGPALESPACVLIGQHCDAAVLVANSGQTRTDEVAHACEQLELSGVTVAGVVLLADQRQSADSLT